MSSEQVNNSTSTDDKYIISAIGLPSPGTEQSLHIEKLWDEMKETKNVLKHLSDHVHAIGALVQSNKIEPPCPVLGHSISPSSSPRPASPRLFDDEEALPRSTVASTTVHRH